MTLLYHEQFAVRTCTYVVGRMCTCTVRAYVRMYVRTMAMYDNGVTMVWPVCRANFIHYPPPRHTADYCLLAKTQYYFVVFARRARPWAQTLTVPSAAVAHYFLPWRHHAATTGVAELKPVCAGAACGVKSCGLCRLVRQLPVGLASMCM